MDWFYNFPDMSRSNLRDFKKSVDFPFTDFSRTYGETIESFFEPLLMFLVWFEKFFINTPWPLIVIGILLLAWVGSRSLVVVLGTFISFMLIGYFGMWEDTMSTLAIILVATFLCISIGIPLGIAMARSNKIQAFVVPILDIMQTIPSFVYLIPVVMLFGVGLTPGVVATIIFALPPIVRLTNIGIRQVGKGFKEAGASLGLTKFKILHRIEIPLAMKTIMAGVNQTLMLALSMVVIAALIGAGGLGLTVYVALGRLDIGGAVIGGTGIVILAIVLDRITQKIIPQDTIKTR